MEIFSFIARCDGKFMYHCYHPHGEKEVRISDDDCNKPKFEVHSIWRCCRCNKDIDKGYIGGW